MIDNIIDINDLVLFEMGDTKIRGRVTDIQSTYMGDMALVDFQNLAPKWIKIKDLILLVKEKNDRNV